MKNRKSFTLLELLVVIGLITVLMSFGIASYSTAQQKARDSKRKSDLKLLQNSMEQYYSICKFKYPLPVSGAFVNIVSNTTDCNVAKNILTNLKDPMGLSYICGGTCDASGYLICPPVGANGKYLETEDCSSSNTSCCLANQQ